VIANRPFEQGDLLRVLARHPLPSIASELQCTSWAQYALKFVVSHPVVTCAIPATTSVAHVRENVAVASSVWPEPAQRLAMQTQVDKLL
jgi:diketogulonate reductase-like aldo/keto reductase